MNVLKNTYKILTLIFSSKFLSHVFWKSNLDAWNEIEKDLIDYNKNLVTLASSAIVLSFTIISLKDYVNSNKWLILTCWILFLIVIFCGIAIYYIKVIHKLIDKSYEKSKDQKKSKTEWLNDPGFQFLIYGISLTLYLLLGQLISFVLAFIFLILFAFLSL